jgi:hypothetical protein
MASRPPAAFPCGRRWTEPPRLRRADGETRRVGVEIEFGGLRVKAAAAAVRDRFGGRLRLDGAHSAVIEGTPFGDFSVEIDLSVAHRRSSSETAEALREAVVGLSSVVIPCEIVCPPMPWDRCHLLDSLVGDLRGLGAEGTREGLFYAFGAQLNPEPHGLDVAQLLPVLRAFVLLRDWLRSEIEVDVARRIWFFESPYPDGYCALILDPDYAPDLPALIDDYIEHNPTRDRELDLLPMLRFLDETRVTRALPHEKINARPTWHYRLPNSEVERADWCIGVEWDRWVRVERLANDRTLLAQASAEWLRNYDSLVPRDWRARAEALARSL